MNNAVAVFMCRIPQWNPDKPVREQPYWDEHEVVKAYACDFGIVREQPYWDEHARFMDSLFEADRVILAGPFGDGSGWMVIVAAESVEAIGAVLRDDPWAQHDILVGGDVKGWTIYLDAR